MNPATPSPTSLYDRMCEVYALRSGFSAAITSYELSHAADVPHDRLDAHRCPPHPGLDYYDNRRPRREGSE